MTKLSKNDLVKHFIQGARENNVGAVLFHQSVGQILGINVTDMKRLDIITVEGSTSPSRVAQLTGLTTGGVTAMIYRLEKQKLIQRKRNPGDRRGTILVLTNEASRKLPVLFESLASAMEAVTSRYSEKELELLSDYFARLGALWKVERAQLQSQ